MQAKKSLGQNFLSNPAIAETILTAGNIIEGDNVLEVGPGKGFLTQALVSRVAHVTAVEKDDRLISVLSKQFPHITLIHSDILEYTPQGTYKIIANIPYYITGEFLRRFLQEVSQPSLMILMVQKEVAERIVANNGKESVLSISVKAFGAPRYIQTIGAENFDPIPKVDSAILGVFDISKKFFTDSNIAENKFFDLIHAGFAHKRKILIKNLEVLCPKDQLEIIWNSLLLDRNVRAEDIHIDLWKKIAQQLNF